MPRYYIVRAVFDGKHESLCVLKHNEVVAGCTFRPFIEQVGFEREESASRLRASRALNSALLAR